MKAIKTIIIALTLSFISCAAFADMEQMPEIVPDEEYQIAYENEAIAIDFDQDPMDEDETEYIYCSCKGIPSSNPQAGLPKTGDNARVMFNLSLIAAMLFGTGIYLIKRERRD